MKTIAIMNQKGGIGKTMTAASIAYLLGEEQGKKVLLVDADQEAKYQPEHDNNHLNRPEASFVEMKSHFPDSTYCSPNYNISSYTRQQLLSKPSLQINREISGTEKG